MGEYDGLGYMPRTGEMRNACKSFVEKSVMKSSFRSLRRSGRRLWLFKYYAI
jgi:hypothetical protein